MLGMTRESGQDDTGKYSGWHVVEMTCLMKGINMKNWKNEAEAREQIKNLVAEYYHDFKEKKEPYKEGDRITYAARVFDEKEMCSLTDAMLDFWLTTGRFSDQFEKEFAAWIGVKYAHLVNSGSSANLIAFMALTAPELKERQILPGTRLSR